MANTFSQVYVQVVFAVRGRENLLQNTWRQELFKYVSGIITAKGHKAIIVGGVSDHIHCLIGIKPDKSISDLVRDIKNNSSKWINESHLVKGKFHWQAGYGVFSYSNSDIDKVYRYILIQENHHYSKTFKEEYTQLLIEKNIDYKTEYLFDFIQDA